MRYGKKNLRGLLLPPMFLALMLIAARAENWPHWRGPHFDGSANEKNLPDDFSKTNNVKWVASLPGPSAATPVVWNDRVFVSSTDTRAKVLRAICLDLKSGKELWNKEVGMGFNQDRMSNLASPSPVTDGNLVYFYYGTGNLVAFDFDGKQIWARDIQKDYGQFAFLWTYSTSPTLVEGKLFIQVLQRDEAVNGRGHAGVTNESYLLALDANTGKEIWKHIRPSEAVSESREAFSTPIPIISYVDTGRFPDASGKAPSAAELPIADFQLLVAGGDCLTAHDGRTGKEIWRWGTWNPTRISHWRLVPSPVLGARAAVVCGPKGAPIYAVKLGKEGTLDDTALRWKSEEREVSSDVSTPLFYKGRFYVVNGEKKTIACVNPSTGKADWIGELGTRIKIESSPTGADGKIYFQNFRGEVFVVEAGEKFKLLRTIPMGDEGDDQLRSSIAAAQGKLFIRTGTKLYCIGQEK